jgi:hypothetical protein
MCCIFPFSAVGPYGFGFTGVFLPKFPSRALFSTTKGLGFPGFTAVFLAVGYVDVADVCGYGLGSSFFFGTALVWGLRFAVAAAYEGGGLFGYGFDTVFDTAVPVFCEGPVKAFRPPVTLFCAPPTVLLAPDTPPVIAFCAPPVTLFATVPPAPFVICFGAAVLPLGTLFFTGACVVAGIEFDRLTIGFSAVDGKALPEDPPWYPWPEIFCPYAEAERSISVFERRRR